MVTGRLDVADDQVQTLGGARRRSGDVPAENNRARRAGGSELDHAEVLAAVEVCVEAPPEPAVKLLGAIDIRDGDNDHLELRGGSRNACILGLVLTTTGDGRWV